MGGGMESRRPPPPRTTMSPSIPCHQVLLDTPPPPPVSPPGSWGAGSGGKEEDKGRAQQAAPPPPPETGAGLWDALGGLGGGGYPVPPHQCWRWVPLCGCLATRHPPASRCHGNRAGEMPAHKVGGGGAQGCGVWHLEAWGGGRGDTPAPVPPVMPSHQTPTGRDCGVGESFVSRVPLPKTLWGPPLKAGHPPPLPNSGSRAPPVGDRRR